MFAIFDAIDSAFGFIPAIWRIGVYGLVFGVIAMLIYWWISPQKRLVVLRQEMADARRAMTAYNGTDGREMLRLASKSISPALRQLLLVLIPTLIAAAPVIAVIAWLESSHAGALSGASGAPAWLSTWHAPYFTGLTISALGMKFGFKIH